MKLSLIYSILFFVASFLSLVVTAALLSSAFSYTVKYGFIVCEKYVIPAFISVVITAIVFYFKKHYEQNSDND